MGDFRFKKGDVVRIKDLDWYNKNKDKIGDVDAGLIFDEDMSMWCSKTMTILEVHQTYYTMKEECPSHYWTDEMIECKVEDDNEVIDIIDEYVHRIKGNECQIDLPEGYQFTDEDGNVISAQKIILEKKPDDKLKLESTKKVREYWSEYTRIFIEIYDDDPNECILTHLYTFEGHRQKGHAKKALAEAELIARKLGCHKAHLKVETNSWMYNWYLRCGYQWYKNADEGYTWLTKSI